MSTPDPLARMEAAFRRAVAAGSFDAARALLAQHGARLEEILASRSPAECEQALEGARRLYEWARRSALAGRAHRARQLADIAASSVYRPSTSAPRHTWELRG